MRKRMDMFGVAVLPGFLSAYGGGTLRDIFARAAAVFGCPKS
ncbi:MAG: TRIC cation channel family protein [Moraxella osloensis]